MLGLILDNFCKEKWSRKSYDYLLNEHDFLFLYLTIKLKFADIYARV